MSKAVNMKSKTVFEYNGRYLVKLSMKNEDNTKGVCGDCFFQSTSVDCIYVFHKLLGRAIRCGGFKSKKFVEVTITDVKFFTKDGGVGYIKNMVKVPMDDNGGSV